MLKQHILVELKQFIQAVSAHKAGGSTRKLTATSLIRSSLHLLEDLPAAREIVFEYFALLVEATVHKYATNAVVDPQTGLPMQPPKGSNTPAAHAPPEDTTFTSVQEVLENLVIRGPTAWGVVIASWSLDLVANLSDKYSKRKMPIGVACNYWLNCGTMRGLIALISMCFRRLSHTEAESCVQTLLTAFQRYPQTFDWVVARLGGCFPQRIISQILQCSLKRFVDDFCDRFESEVGILEHLCTAHELDVKNSLFDLLEEGFEPKKSLDASIVPFMIVLISGSDLLLQVMADVLIEIYTDEFCPIIVQRAPLWGSNRFFSEMLPNFNNILLRLLWGGTELLLIVAKLAEQYSWCQDFLEYTLQELEQYVLNTRSCHFITDLATSGTEKRLWYGCVSDNRYEQQTAIRLILIGASQHPQIYYHALSELLRQYYDETPDKLGSIIRLMAGQGGLVDFPEITAGIAMVLQDMFLQERFDPSRFTLVIEPSEVLNTFKNLLQITRMQKQNSFPFVRPGLLVNTLNECLPKILEILEVTINAIMLRMDKEAAAEAEKKLKASREAKEEIPGITTEPPAPAAGEETKKEEKYEAAIRAARATVAMDEEEKERAKNRIILVHVIIDLLNAIEAGSKFNYVDTSDLLKLASLTSKYFFISVAETDLELRFDAVNRAFALLHRQSAATKTARSACLRELIEGALFYHGYLFGQCPLPNINELEIPNQEMVVLQNQRQNVGPNVNRTLLHAGVIGRGLRPDALNPHDYSQAESHALLVKALDSCCADPDLPYSTEGYSMVSLMLVEMVSTDVMYNGLPFPDEEFTKVTMERDLMIKRAFFSSPVLWALLGFIAEHRPALCFSSVLLRALCATCLHQWRARNVNKLQPVSEDDELIIQTKKVLRVLAMGQLLPPPLSDLHVIIHYFDAPEIALLLRECVWNYLKDHVPSPALFQLDNNGLHWRDPSLDPVPPVYVDTLRHMMQTKLDKLGQYYYQMFVLPGIDDEEEEEEAGPTPETLAMPDSLEPVAVALPPPETMEMPFDS